MQYSSIKTRKLSSLARNIFPFVRVTFNLLLVYSLTPFYFIFRFPVLFLPPPVLHFPGDHFFLILLICIHRSFFKHLLLFSILSNSNLALPSVSDWRIEWKRREVIAGIDL